MQALHHKLNVVLVQILRYNCSETDYSFCEDLPPSRTAPSTRMLVPPHYFFRSAAPSYTAVIILNAQSLPGVSTDCIFHRFSHG